MIELMKQIDFHVHTNRSVCCQQNQTIPILINYYSRIGIKHFALCDHYYRNKVHLFEEAKAELISLKATHDLDIRLSAELEIVDNSGTIDCPEYDAISKLLDHISVALHTKNLIKTVPQRSDKLEYIHSAHMAALNNPEVDVILHPWDGIELVVPGLDHIPSDYLKEFAAAAAKSDKIIEISNCANHWWVRPRSITDTYGILVKELIDAGVKLVIGSDGHNMDVLPDISHLSGGVTTGDTSWAVNTVKNLGGTDYLIRLPRIRR